MYEIFGDMGSTCTSTNATSNNSTNATTTSCIENSGPSYSSGWMEKPNYLLLWDILKTEFAEVPLVAEREIFVLLIE